MEKWLTEVNEVMKEALDLVSNGELNQVNMYKLAPRLYSNRYGTISDLMLIRMFHEVEEQVKMDWYSDTQSKQHFRFHFVSAYILCFLVAGKLTQQEYDHVMSYINKEMTLFEE
ncbi:hypothetical protein [Vibrio antiquarius]|nr:hypothetical protein [Vibrio antiquarius]MCS0024037.1 hypothetical protein [Vibrio antiquarius]